jgi:hypothetical protein
VSIGHTTPIELFFCVRWPHHHFPCPLAILALIQLLFNNKYSS